MRAPRSFPPAHPLSRALLNYLTHVTVSLLVFLGLLVLLARGAHAQEATGASPRLRRFALIVSSNDGGTGRAPLRFANTDARAMSDVLMQLGGLSPRDLILLPNANRTSVESGFDQLRTQLGQPATPGTRRELFVYYSGHSDEQGLLLGKDRITYRELRQWISDLGADVRIAVLDSCASGALIRLKGGAIRAPFLADVSTDARGHAFLTASSADESAQESDRVGAAFFTHYLVSGLRGAADASRDGRVTLGEAYQYAYDETLRRTENSRAGAQHPAYDIQLAGTGDLVMTDLRTTDAALVLGEKLAGRIYVRDASGRLLVELRKEPVYPVELGLSPGDYRVLLDADGRPFEAKVTLSQGSRKQLAQNDFRSTQALVTTVRGNSPPRFDAPLREVGFDLVAAPGVRLSGGGDEPVRHRFVLGLLGHSHELEGAQLSLAGNMVERTMSGAQLAAGFNLTKGFGKGAQLAGGVNIATGGFTGFAGAGLANVSRGPFKGAQLSSLNWSDGDFTGLQAASINFNDGAFRGLQAASVNVNGGGFTGMQAGAVNVNGGWLKGVQAGAVNVSEGLNGVQVAAVNIGGDVSGTQIAAINVARKVRGAQIGVINVAESVEGESLGLLPLVKDGYHRLALWSSDLSLSNLGIKLGGRHVYTLLGGGLGSGNDERRTYSTFVGLGGHITPWGGPLFLDIDLVATQQGNRDDFGERDSLVGTLRVVLGYEIARSFAVTLGPTYNVLTSWEGQDYETGLGVFEKVYREGDTTVRLFPGFVLGVQI